MKIIWTKNAEKRFTEILDYIEMEFGQTSRDHFKTKTKDFTTLLKEFPEIGTLEVRFQKCFENPSRHKHKRCQQSIL